MEPGGGGGGGERYDIDFQVLRPSPVSDPGVDCYSLVGSNFVDNGRPNDPVHRVDRCIIILCMMYHRERRFLYSLVTWWDSSLIM